MKEIIIDIGQSGEVRIETRGFKGSSCITESQFIKDVLGVEAERMPTPCYFQEGGEIVTKYLPLCG